ncbi:MAG: outer membrane beta-barrel protein [Pseudomonadota bacterium]
MNESKDRTRAARFVLAIAAGLLAVGATYADDDTGLFLDASFGRAQLDNEIAGLFLEDDAAALRFGLGYDFGNNIALEGTYVNLGEVESDILGPGNDGTTSGLVLAARFTLPVTETLSASARMGGFFWEAEIDTLDGEFVNEGEDIVYGVGLDFAATERLALTAAWDRFEFGDSDADVIWAGLRFRF